MGSRPFWCPRPPFWLVALPRIIASQAAPPELKLEESRDFFSLRNFVPGCSITFLFVRCGPCGPCGSGGAGAAAVALAASSGRVSARRTNAWESIRRDER